MTSADSSSRLDLDDLFQNVTIPSFPAAIVSVLRKLRDPDVPVDHIAEAVMHDPGTVVRVLKTVNSAAFGSRRPIDNVAHAVSYMGRGKLENDPAVAGRPRRRPDLQDTGLRESTLLGRSCPACRAFAHPRREAPPRDPDRVLHSRTASGPRRADAGPRQARGVRPRARGVAQGTGQRPRRARALRFRLEPRRGGPTPRTAVGAAGLHGGEHWRAPRERLRVRARARRAPRAPSA